MSNRDLHKSELERIYKAEQFQAEKRINQVTLPVILFYLVFTLILPLFTETGYDNPNMISNLTAILIFLVYQLIIFTLIRRNQIHWIVKYLTMFFTVTIISIATYGYHYGTDFVHSTRTITITSYFLAIILSGQYQNPKLSLYTALLTALEYSGHFLSAFFSGFPVYSEMETFRQNILTWDILIVNLSFFFISGILMFLNSRRPFQLIVELRQSWEKLFIEQKRSAFLENFDELTKLHNLKSFQERLDRQIVRSESRQQRFTVLCLGIDGFKSINQLYGVSGGNKLLKDVGERLKKSYREDDFICRFMGDKFLVLFPDPRAADNISHLIGKSRECFSLPFSLDNLGVKLTACGGFCSYPNDGDVTEILIEKAESAMYEAKESGKNSFRLFNRNNQSELEQRIVIEKALEQAIENSEFKLVYQPKVREDGRIQGMESLIRWNHPELGFIRPDVFIPIAEKSGDIIEIGYFVIRECCRQIRRWTELGLRARRITVNVSPFQFLHREFITRVEAIIGEFGINPAWLGIELTESGMMIEESECIFKLQQLKDMGLTISIDDFGTGFSSLSRLGNYPLDTLKIDKSFVDGLPDSNTAVCLVRSILDLAQNLGYSVVAEGVELREQIDFLLQMGCHIFQGYYYYKPLPPDEMEAYLIKEE